MTQTVLSARSGTNPFATFNCFCMHIKIKEHAQLTGVLSFAVFICLCVIAVVTEYWPMAILFIVAGIFIYAYLMETLFRNPKKVSVLAYLVFETLQIGFYIAFAIFLIAVLIFNTGYYYYDYDDPIYCDSTATNPSTTTTTTMPLSKYYTTTREKETITTTEHSHITNVFALDDSYIDGPHEDYIQFDSNPQVQPSEIIQFDKDKHGGSTTQAPDGCYYYVLDKGVLFTLLYIKISGFIGELLVFVLFLVLIKAYFATVFSRYYKFLVFALNRANTLSTQYINGRGVQIQMDDQIFPTPPLYTNSIIQDRGYTYSLHQEGELPQLPTYTELTSAQPEKDSLPPETTPNEPALISVQSDENVKNENRIS